LIVACNFTQVARDVYRIGVPFGGKYAQVLNSDDAAYGGAGLHTTGEVEAVEEEWNGRPWHIQVKLPPLASIAFELKGKPKKVKVKAAASRAAAAKKPVKRASF
jgi:1,4-alpha-glucan branching enzyme